MVIKKIHTANVPRNLRKAVIVCEGKFVMHMISYEALNFKIFLLASADHFRR